MKKIHQQAEQAAKEMQIIADNLGDYNPGLCKDKVPLDVLQHDLACFGREITWLYSEIGKKIREGK